MHFSGLQLSGALEEFSITSQVLGSKMQKSNLLKKIRVLSAVCFRIDVQVISNPSCRLEKKPTKPMNVCLLTIFYDFI